ncbi:hypothetical protein SAMN05443529_11613 [Desulfosporosinus hippei DSM 8344]|uniref:Uncharacterized protein n=1 Tax=Desulfosporosinus hippei DSM 8344 TaxID=1121419 RepID=A0A1G8E0K5_9FIRM|nr:hypothetical protein SAMN05443529_11613 [Desulfosporosinus hippei DSM 8344]
MNYMGPSIGLGIFSFFGLVIYLGFFALVVYLIISTIKDRKPGRGNRGLRFTK